MPLLTNLVLAFEKLVGRYTLIAKEMSWINRNGAQSHQDTVDPRMIQVIKDWGAQAEQDIHELLKLAKRDVILLGSKNHNIDKLIIAPVGPEFLLTALLRDVQNDTILQGTGQKVDIVKYYRNLTNKTRFGAVRDPKRQRFLEISALEEELEALRKVNRVQKRLFLAWERMLRPDGFQSATTEWTYVKDRQAMYPLESKLVASHETKLTDDDKSLEGLQNIARGLRYDLKQSIEILEEGHGKAIRVFTIVTLFFLPLSFVTSFFGMNTTDVRDTDWDQRMFWACALPVTVGVLTLAFVYGYKWDMITEALSRRLLLPAARAKSPYHILEDDLIPLTGAKNQDRPKRSRAHAESSSKTRTQLFVSKFKNKTGTKSTPIQRRQTGDSLLY
ncbi:hypothetical protein PG991_001823 [Apiospora marii]|uniref:Uncharacterized protein n=2 Tax=Apiospora marii TaxID=335849 RepID=A0ABR1SPY8_9PEZI